MKTKIEVITLDATTIQRHQLIPCENYEATYCPEDDKLRLYVGRVPRDEYNFLRAEGWTSTPKQSEAGQGEFSAVWTPGREATAIQYAGFIGDEDTPPTERAADRAERFGGYMEKRADEAAGHADRYDSQPQAHGFQNERKAERAAARHDRIGDRATDQWGKAEYWQRRTAGVIQHALYKSSPEVRMGRIKTLEAELRKVEKSWQESTERAQARYDALLSVVEHAADTREKLKPADRQDFVWELSKIRKAEDTPDEEKSPPEHYRRAVIVAALSTFRDSESNKALAKEAEVGSRAAAEIAAEWLEGKARPEDWNPETGSEWTRHLKLRLAYENQMLEAQGGRAAFVEMEAGGFIGGHQITKVTKSPATGRVVSVEVQHMSETNQYGRPWSDGKGARMLKTLINIERMGSNIYRPPTDEERAAYAAKIAATRKANAKAAKEKAAAGENCPLINPTDEDAERLQAMINERHAANWIRHHGKPTEHYKPKTAQVERITQAVYSVNSKGSYAKAETRGLCANGVLEDRFSIMWSSAAEAREKSRGPAVCKIRIAGYEPERVLIITDKPQKPLPAAVWAAYTPPAEKTKQPELQTV